MRPDQTLARVHSLATETRRGMDQLAGITPLRITGREAIPWSRLCTPGMDVNLWGASPLYMNPTTVVRQQTKY